MRKHGWWVMALGLGFSLPLYAERPFFSEEAQVLEKGSFSFDVGVGYRDEPRDFGIVDRDTQTEIATTRLRFGLGDAVEVQVTGTALLVVEPLSEIGPDNEKTGSGDWRLGTKVRLVGEKGSRPALSFLYEVKLPNRSDEDGGATDETDFFAFLLLSKKLAAKTLFHANFGLGILGDPATNRAQNDVFLLRLAWEQRLSPRQLLGIEGLLQAGPKSNDDPTLLRLVYALRLGKWTLWSGAGVGQGEDSDNARLDLGLRRRFRLFRKAAAGS